MPKKLFIRLEIIGAFFSYLMVLFLHNGYYIIQSKVIAILFTSVNNSVWEHVKVFTLPYVFWCFIELCFIQEPFKKFVVSKIIGLYFLILSTTIVFSLYFAIIGKSSFIFDVVFAGILIALSYYISYLLINSKLNFNRYFYLALVFLAIFLSVYMVFTVTPPKVNLFRDPFTGYYGLSEVYDSVYTFIKQNIKF